MRWRFLRTVGRAAAASSVFAVLGAAGCQTSSTKDGTPSLGWATQAATKGADAGCQKYDVKHVAGDPSLTPKTVRFDQLKDPWTADTADACKALKPAAGSGFPATRACGCDHCLELMHQCDALQGCIEILDCILTANCTDPNSCYLSKKSGDPTGCVDVIDKWGNTGDAVAIANTIGTTCLRNTANNCPATPQ
jgi:hypothetical protein